MSKYSLYKPGNVIESFNRLFKVMIDSNTREYYLFNLTTGKPSPYRYDNLHVLADHEYSKFDTLANKN